MELEEFEEITAKGRAQALVKTPKQKRAAEKRAAKQALDAESAALAAKDLAAAQRLAQIVNLHIAGHSLAAIGAQIGATAQEVDRMLAQDAQRYVRSQPALRVYVRNYISERYTSLLEAVWDEAVNKQSKAQLEHQDRALRILDRMAKLHGAEAPTQAEVTVDAAPEAVDRMVQALAAQRGAGYDVSVFDVVPGETVHRAHEQAVHELLVSGNRLEEAGPDDDL